MEPDLKNVRIILVEPTGAFNIGSVARIIKNMGMSELGLVKPVDFHNDEAYMASVGARDVLDGALVYRSFPEAIQDTHLVAGTTRRGGRSRRIFCTVEELSEKIFPVLKEGKVAIVFGREQSGLNNREADLCHILLNIPADSSFPSLNLSHAVAVVCYKLFTDAMIARVPYISKPVNSTQIEGLLDYIHTVFSDLGFFTKGPPDYVISLFRKIFGRALLNQEEINNLTHIFHRLHGLCKERKQR
ncbi:MAG: RNA methyltransferase [Spirochaetota bacterium]